MKIKHFSFVLLLVLCLSSCSSVKYLSTTASSDKKVMKTFLKDIEEVVLNKHYTVLMTYMDSDYLKEQHQGFLNGNDLQFINEIFCGKDITDNSFHCIEQKSILWQKIVQFYQADQQLAHLGWQDGYARKLLLLLDICFLLLYKPVTTSKKTTVYY